MKKKPDFNLVQEMTYLIKFGLVGVVNTALSALVMWLLSLTGLTYPWYSALGYAVGIANSFVLNFFFTFRRPEKPLVVMMVQFVAVGAVMVLVAEGVQHVLITWWNLPELVGVALGMVVYTAGGFLLNRLWVFNNQKQE